MAKEITAGVLLNLKDQFSSKIKGAGISVQGFADKAVGVANKVNQAFSGLAGTLGGLGVSIGALAAINSTINLDNRMARLGLTANASAGQVNALKRQIFETAQMPDIKLDTDSIISGLEVVMTKVGDLQFVEGNVRNIALAIQASGESGDSMGAVFAEFAKFGYSVEEILPLMDDLIAQGDQGAFTFGEFAKNAPAVFSAYSAIGTTPENIRKANAAMQILMAGTKSADIAVTALNSAMAELADPEKQKKLRMMGIAVRDSGGNFRDFNDIMFDIVAKAEEIGNADIFGSIFGTTSMSAVRAYMTQGERMFDGLTNLGDTAGLLQQKSATMANTLKSNLQNLQTAFLSFADKNLTGPLEKLTDFLNRLAENPEKIEAGIKGIAVALGILAGIKITAGIVSFIANLKGLQSGGGLNASALANAGGGAGIPVHVTNLGGSGGALPLTPGLGGGAPTLLDQFGKPMMSGKTPSLLDASGNPVSRTAPPPGNTQQPSPGNPGNRPGIGQTPTGQPVGTPLAAGGKAQQAFSTGKTALTSVTPTQMALGGATAGIGTALVKIPEMIGELNAIDQDESLTSRERGEAKGGAVGDATGSIIGAAAGGAAGIAAGAAVGAAVGSVVPVLGTAVGALVGAGIGALGMWLGGKAGRAVGSAIGGAVSGDDETVARSPEAVYTSSAAAYPGITGSPGIAPPYTGSYHPYAVNDLIVTPQGQFSTHPDDYIFAMKNPAALVNNEMRNEVRTVERVPQALPPVMVNGEIALRSELVIDDKGYRLRQSVGKNTTPYKFSVGNASDARMI
ncbi:MAG: phage tail tape measure protein [Treponema sp.]|jgi:hypothetical protein|nr:phage tail tape measure protein [Treponema sp.]